MFVYVGVRGGVRFKFGVRTLQHPIAGCKMDRCIRCRYDELMCTCLVLEPKDLRQTVFGSLGNDMMFVTTANWTVTGG